jgi:hypothetical protein
MVHTRCQRSDNQHLSIRPTVTPRLVCQHTENKCHISVARWWQLNLYAHLLRITLPCLRVPNMWKSLPAETVTGYSAMAGRLWITLHTVLNLKPVISIPLDATQSTWMASNLHKMLTWRKLPPPSTWHQFLECWDTSHGASLRQTLKCQWWLYNNLMCAIWSATRVLHTHVCVCVCVRVRACVRACVCVCVLKSEWSSHHQIICYLTFLNPFVIVNMHTQEHYFTENERTVSEYTFILPCFVPEF